MSKLKKALVDYRNVLENEFEENFLNCWTNNTEKDEENIKICSYLFKISKNSIIQIILSNKPVYNGIYHITKFKVIKKEEEYTLKIKDLDVLNQLTEKDLTFEDIKKQLPKILKNYGAKEEYIDYILLKFQEIKDPISNIENYKRLTID